MPKARQNDIALAACSFEIGTEGAIQLFPAGKFDAPRGSMLGLTGPWFIDDVVAASVLAKLADRENKIVIDYEHQTIKSATNGQPAPAAGWIKPEDIKWIPGKGLVAANVEWTEQAKAFIAAGEYKYISPVFTFSKSTGHVLDVRQVALSNDVAIDGMDEVTLAAATAMFLPNQQEDYSMNEQLLKALGLKKDASEADAIAAASAMTTKITDLEGQLKDKDEAIAAASAGGTEAIAALQAEVAALTKTNTDKQMDEMIAAATADGKLIPAQEKWARGLGVDGLNSYLESAPKIAALTAKQTDVQPVDDEGNVELTDSQVAICSAMGLTQDEYKAQLTQESK